MIIDEIKNIPCGRKDLRKFGLSVGIILVLIGFYLLLRTKTSSAYFIASGVLLIIPALIFPDVLKPFHKVWMIIAILLGWFSTRIILSFLYYVIVTPIGFLLRISGKDLLDKKIQKEKTTYWNYRVTKAYEPADSEKQF